MSSLTGAFPSPNSIPTPVNQFNNSYQQQPNFGFIQPNNNLGGSMVTMPQQPFYNQAQSPHSPFNQVPNFPNSGYYNQGMEMPSQMKNWGGPMNIVPESDRSYSSTRQIRKAL